MAVMNVQLRELNGRIKANIASNKFGNVDSTRGDMRALGTLVTEFIHRVDELERGKAIPDDPTAIEAPVVKPVGTNLDAEEDEDSRD